MADDHLQFLSFRLKTEIADLSKDLEQLERRGPQASLAKDLRDNDPAFASDLLKLCAYTS